MFWGCSLICLACFSKDEVVFSNFITNNTADNANFQQSCNLLPDYYDYVLIRLMVNVIHASILDVDITIK